LIQASLGDVDSAMKWLEKSYEERQAMLQGSIFRAR
jgi:hypothetical protein